MIGTINGTNWYFYSNFLKNCFLEKCDLCKHCSRMMIFTNLMSLYRKQLPWKFRSLEDLQKEKGVQNQKNWLQLILRRVFAGLGTFTNSYTKTTLFFLNVCKNTPKNSIGCLVWLHLYEVNVTWKLREKFDVLCGTTGGKNNLWFLDIV